MDVPPGLPFDSRAVLVRLGEDGHAVPLPWTPDVFRRLAARGQDRVIGMKRGIVPADFHADEWEMHPAGDELLYLLTGALDVVLEEATGTRTFRLDGGQACVVPRGTWHRLIVDRPSDLLFVTPAHGTRHRPVGSPAAGG